MSARRTPCLDLVTGKGGVGKSTFVAALALRWARQGERVLAVEMGAPGGVARLLGACPLHHGEAARVAGAGSLHVAYFDGAQALAEYLFRRLPLGRFEKAVVTHPLYRAFVDAGPGVTELMAIGKVRDELLGLAHGRARWDRLVVDLGASGHALQMLAMPAAAALTFTHGLAHREARRVAELLADPRISAVHVVALPEQMPLAEARQVITRLATLGLPLGRLVVNRCRRPAPAGTEDALKALEELGGAYPDASRLALSARRELGWLTLQELGIATLEHELDLRALRLERIVALQFGLAEVAVLAEHIQREAA